MAMCGGSLFTAQKDGSLRYWHDVDSALSTRESTLRREDRGRFVNITPSSRVLSFVHLQVCSDPTRRAFILAYIGDGLDRRTHCGVFSIPADISRHVDPPSSASTLESLCHFDEGKGVVTISVSPKWVVVAGSGGAISIIDIKSREKYSAHVQVSPSDLCQGTDTVKILRLHVISEDSFLVLTSQAAMVYAIPSHQNPHSTSPVFVHTFPRTASAWIQPPGAARPDVLVTLLNTEGQILQFNIGQDQETSAWSVSAQSESDSVSKPTPFPYPVDRLSLTDMRWGAKRSVWVHWERGVDGWPLRVLGGDASSTKSFPNSLDGVRQIRPNIEFRDLMKSETVDGVSGLPELVEMCTRSVSMPKICFDEARGRLVMAGPASPSLVLCDFA
ncbi:hypothetical protein FRB96_001686 [Tulasnella sp. 330]|nr:hypothetical protein FRB96_001686 [Tulasnella sp. 330]KAG8882112.1 hypothetical protein FRB97_008678 [Tulasnella sp. 331]KAG8888009.1 hypothetical protein FRB98_008607 [Tulasnella sp. 332]